MKRSHVATKLDLEAFARDGASLTGEWPATDLPRLVESGRQIIRPLNGRPSAGACRGIAPARAAAAQIWLHLQAQAELDLTCQRCLQAFRQPLHVDRWLRFVNEESEAAALDVDSDDDVLALERHLDAQALVEDELLLALPIVPRHEVCPQPLVAANTEPADAEPIRPNPAALAAPKPSPGKD